MLDLDRRQFTRGLLAAMAAAGAPRIAFARAATEKRFVLIVLRGGMDGLTALPPVGDPAYAGLRGRLAIQPPGSPDGALPLDGFFGLHPALTGFHGLWQAGQLQTLHAVSSPYRGRSHFDAQNVLESGGRAPDGSASGWLNRLVGTLGGSVSALAVGYGIPLVLSGSQRVATWFPTRQPAPAPDLWDKLATLYDHDEAFHNALTTAKGTDDLVQSTQDEEQQAGMFDRRQAGKGPDPSREIKLVFEGLGMLMREDGGPRIASVDVFGWDTHINEGAEKGLLANRLADLDAAVTALKEGLGEHWRSTVVVAVSEFGRTATVNGNGGTDHGTGGAAFVLGGAVGGARCHAQWPGVAEAKLLEARDLAPTADVRAAFATVAVQHFGLPMGRIGDTIFPGSDGLGLLNGMLA